MKRILFVLALTLCLSCTNDSYSDLISVETTLPLKWNKSYNDDSIDKAKIGLEWTLSYLGATLPHENSGISIEGNIIIIDIMKLGFEGFAEQKLLQLLEVLKNSSEYQQTNTIDLGRFVSLLLGASEHYYQIVGTPETLDELLQPYQLLPDRGYIDNSIISNQHRIIEFSELDNLKQVFVSKEIDPNTGTILEYETIELIANGQIRFGIFDANGFRKSSASPNHTAAGKPAKCMWCHESSINPMFTPQNDFEGFLGYDELQNVLLTYKSEHLQNREILTPNGVNFNETQQHTLTELLYISFMEPSAERLSREWNLPLSEVENLLSGLDTHIYDEFPFLGDLYHRAEAENLAPFSGIPVSGNVREPSTMEVNYLDF
ncbi:hypothetical protein [Mangrovimonas sp. TPBH4]|uniref:hypothetical protein n=1 Tax=Mangrovimonas sp. TPBH4 TaxID=1645914 RepID=UPI0006B6401D|nr:hypothetical protein [Mangrovimonas sp. TPBH4]